MGYAASHLAWEDQRHLLTLHSPQLFSDPSMCLSIARQSSAFPCVSRSRAERGACEAPQMVLTEAEQWLLYWERTQLSCWGTQGQEIRSGIIQSALHSLPGEAPAENGLSIPFINCKGTIWVSSVSSPGSCSASVQCRDTRASSSAVQFVPQGFTPALTQRQQPEHPHTSAPPVKNEHPEEEHKNSSLGKVCFLCI